MSWQSIECPNCQGAIQAFPAMFGSDVDCPHCRQRVTIAMPSLPVPVEPGEQLDPYDRLREDASPIYWIIVTTLVIVGLFGFLFVLLGLRLFG